MNIYKLYRNPEVKKITIKYIGILLVGIILISLSVKLSVDKLNSRIIDQNILIISKVINNKDISEIVTNLYEKGNEEDIEEAKDILASYGYDHELSLEINEVISYFSTEILILVLPIFIILFGVIYILYIRQLNSIYKRIDDIVIKVSNMSHGEYKAIAGDFDEGEMAILVSSLNYMGERVNNSIRLLKEEKENLKDFLADISHQLKTPLSSLVMFNDLLRQNENMPYEDRVKFLDKSEEQLSRMEWLIMNLLKVGRIEAGAIIFHEYDQSLRETIELSVSSLNGMAKKKEQKLVIGGDLDTVLFHDREWLAEALSNIIKNAIEHTPNNGIINISVDNGPLITKIIIKDNGKGIPKDMQSKIFKRFYKGENSTDPRSIGIGLSLSKGIIEKLGGEIKLISEEGKGTTFIISFIESLKKEGKKDDKKSRN